MSPPVAYEPGISNETSQVVFVEGAIKGTPHFEETEDIETIFVPVQNLQCFLDSEAEKGVHVDSRLYYFALGLNFQK